EAEAEDPEAEDPEAEDPAAEDPEAEDPETEEPETEDPETEDPETEDPETEDPETEDPETEDPETEDPGDQPEDEEPAVDACPDVEGVQVDAAECEVGLVPPFVVENDDAEVAADGEVAGPRGPARRPTEVAGIQVLPQGRTGTAQQLPRTGADTTALALAGLGLVLMGAGAVVAARRPSGAPVR